MAPQQRRENDARRRQKSVPSSNSNRNYLTPQDGQGNKADGKIEEVHSLRRKPKFSEIVRNRLWGQQAADSEEHLESRAENIHNDPILGKAMPEGNLGRVVPPSRVHAGGGRLAPSPPRPPRPQTARQLPPPRVPQVLHLPQPLPPHIPYVNPVSDGKSGSSKRRSASSKVATYIAIGADILDETRREFVGKFRPPFENLSYRSFSLSGRKSKLYGSNDSSKSFFCVGEDEITKESPAAKKGIQRDTARRLSGDGTDPWTQGAPTFCRLCKKAGVRGVRGLCEECERDFMRPKTQVFESSSSYAEIEIKPTPPLKDRKTLYVRKDSSKAATQVSGGERGDQRPRSQVQAWLQDDEKSSEWRRHPRLAEYKVAKKNCASGPECCERSDFDKFEEEDDSNRAIESERRVKRTAYNVRRHSTFYEFYDDLLKAGGAKPPSNR